MWCTVQEKNDKTEKLVLFLFGYKCGNLVIFSPSVRSYCANSHGSLSWFVGVYVNEVGV